MSPVYGLVVCGGKSSRMGTDKSLLVYHGQPQRYHVYQMLQALCDRVFLSVNSSQVPDIPSEYEYIVDDPEYADIGPMGALLTAFTHYPNASFLVVGCDYPFINEQSLQRLLKVKHEAIPVTSFYSNSTNLYEPLLAHYQSHISSYLQCKFKQKSFSLQTIFRELSPNVIIPSNEITIRSIDTMDKYKDTIMQLYSKRDDNIF